MRTIRTPGPGDGVAWITGASSGIGEAVALRLAAAGWTVAASARSAEKLAALAARAPGPGRIVPAPLDVTDREAVRRTVEALRAAHGAVALAILNAGTYQPDQADRFDAAAFRATHELNVMGTAHCLEAVMPAMIARGLGHLVVVSSVAGYRGLPRALAYGSSKAALINLAESLKLDVERHGLKVQLVNPGFIRTPLTDRNDFPMPFLMEVDRAAERMVAEMRGDGFEITFPRRFTWMLQRLRCLPYPLYFSLARKARPK
ncbi:MAG TPA: SDR family NAD(P)-dependent oxidoreductase [Azospirillaceae bacterium]|nr:SDR family NAD(P)-dependent oxidoreductase [Azospirillaceae bacterium]